MSVIEISTHSVENTYQKAGSFLIGCSGTYYSSSRIEECLSSALVTNQYIPISGVDAFGYPYVQIHTEDYQKIATVVIYETTPNYLLGTDLIHVFYYQGSLVSEDSYHSGSSVGVQLEDKDEDTRHIISNLECMMLSLSKCKN